MRRGTRTFSLATPAGLGGAEATASFVRDNEFALLMRIEQSALQASLSKSAKDIAPLLRESDHQREADRESTLASLQFMAWAAAFAARASASERRFRSPLSHLRDPLAFLEYRRAGKTYRCFAHRAPDRLKRAAEQGEKEDAMTVVRLARYLADEYAQRRPPNTDEEAAAAWRRRFADAARLDDGLDGLHARTSEVDELAPLMKVVAEHVCRRPAAFKPAAAEDAARRRDPDAERSQDRRTSAARANAELSQDERAGVAAWRDMLESAGGRRGEDVDHAQLSVYPYVRVETLANAPSVLAVTIVSPIDQWFFDNSLPQDIALPEILVGFFDVSDPIAALEPDALTQLEDALQARLGEYLFKLITAKRGRALEAAAGDAAEISRHWFGRGVPALLGEAHASGLHYERATDFWERFVKELLCARVDGVNNVETFPFDRVYIFERTAAGAQLDAAGNDENGARSKAARAGERDLSVRVLEAAIESRAADKRFQYLTSLEDRGGDINDLELTRKEIKGRADLAIRPGEAEARLLLEGVIQVDPSIAENEGASRNFDFSTLAERRGDHAGSDHVAVLEHVMTGLLGALVARDRQEEDAVRAARTDVRGAFDADGLLYEYRNSVDMKRDAPTFYELDRAYKELYRERLRDNGLTLGRTVGEGGREDSKYVVISYEPTLVQANVRRAEPDEDDAGDEDEAENPNAAASGSKYFVGPDQAVTVVIVADVDVEKGVQEIESERNDLRVLVEMIVKQRMREAIFLQTQIRKKANLVYGLVQSFIHKIQNNVTKERRDEINATLNGLADILRFDRGSLEEIPASRNLAFHLAQLLPNSYFEEMGRTNTIALADVERALKNGVRKCAAEENKDSDVEVRLTIAPSLPVSLRTPKAAVRECLDVMLTNAAQAAAHRNAPTPAFIHVHVATRPGSDKDRWALEVIVENSCMPPSASVWRALTAQTPRKTQKNADKQKSTGVGVWHARSVLREGLGEDADITYQLAEDKVVQARLTLPAHAEQASPGGLDAAPSARTPAASAPAVIYIEDEPDHYGPSLDWLRRRAGDRVRHAECLTDAIALFGQIQRSPAVVISDLNIPKEPGATAAGKHGPAAVKKAMEFAAERGARPPIWIVTGSKRDEAAGKLRGVDKHGYRIAEAAEGVDALAEPGVVTVLEGVKDLGVCGPLGPALETVLTPSSSAVHETEMSAQPDAVAAAPVLNVVAVRLPDEVDVRLVERVAQSSQAGVAAVAVAQAPGGFSKALAAWIAHPGCPDPDTLEHDDADTPLWDSLIHNWIVLHAPPAARAKQLAPAARYWLLRHNVVTAAGEPEEIGRLWGQMLNEPSGPIARLRHDARNLRFARTRAKHFADIEKRTAEIERMLSLGDERERALEDALRQDAAAAATALPSELRAAPANVDDEASVAEVLAMLDKTLASIADDPGVAPDIARLRKSLAAAKQLLSLQE